MGLGDIIRADFPDPVLIYRKLANGQTAAPGKPVGWDTSGDIIIADNTTDGPFGAMVSGKDASTPLFVTVGGVNYYACLISGDIVMQMGGAVQPNKWVSVGSSGNKLVALAKQSISAGYVQAESQAIQNENWHKFGRYLRLEADDEITASAAADTNSGVIRLGGP
jgi:hypothetical protein